MKNEETAHGASGGDTVQGITSIVLVVLGLFTLYTGVVGLLSGSVNLDTRFLSLDVTGFAAVVSAIGLSGTGVAFIFAGVLVGKGAKRGLAGNVCLSLFIISILTTYAGKIL